MAAVTKHDETVIGHILAGSHLSRLDPIDCQNYIFDQGISPEDLKEGFSWLQARIEAFNARSEWVWAERAAKAHRLALHAAALTMVSTPLAAAEALPHVSVCFDKGVMMAGGVWLLSVISLAGIAFMLGSSRGARQDDEL